MIWRFLLWKIEKTYWNPKVAALNHNVFSKVVSKLLVEIWIDNGNHQGVNHVIFWALPQNWPRGSQVAIKKKENKGAPFLEALFCLLQMNHKKSSCLFVWDIEQDKIQIFDFAIAASNHELDDNIAATQQQLASSIKGINIQNSSLTNCQNKMLIIVGVYLLETFLVEFN